MLPPLTYNKQNKTLGSEKVKNTYNLALVLDIFKFNRGISNLLSEIKTEDSQRLADIILQEMLDATYGIAKDDMTVMVVKVV